MRWVFKVYLICHNKQIGYGCGFVYVCVKVGAPQIPGEGIWTPRTGVTSNCEPLDLGTGNRILCKQFAFWSLNSLSSPVFAFLITQNTLGENKYIKQTTGCLGMGNGLSF